MADEETSEPAASPPDAHASHGHDEIHMPPNSYWPAATALGAAIAMVGVITVQASPIVLIVGILILLAGVGAWVRDARKEYQELP
jgi:hypothetical protein